MSSIKEKFDLVELLKDYRVENVDAFRSYLTSVWKDLAERSNNNFKGINKITFAKYYELPGIIFDLLKKEPSKRMDIKKVLDHPWLKKCLKEINGTTISNVLNVNTVTSGGNQFKIYSSPVSIKKSIDIMDNDSFKLEDSDESSKGTILNVFGMGSTILPIYKNSNK